MTTSPTPPAARLGGMDLAELRAALDELRKEAFNANVGVLQMAWRDFYKSFTPQACEALLDALAAKAAEVERLREELRTAHQIIGDFTVCAPPSTRWKDDETYTLVRKPTAGLIRRAFDFMFPDRAALSTDEPST